MGRSLKNSHKLQDYKRSVLNNTREQLTSISIMVIASPLVLNIIQHSGVKTKQKWWSSTQHPCSEIKTKIWKRKPKEKTTRDKNLYLCGAREPKIASAVEILALLDMSKHYPLNRNKKTTTTSHRCGSTHHPVSQTASAVWYHPRGADKVMSIAPSCWASCDINRPPQGTYSATPTTGHSLRHEPTGQPNSLLPSSSSPPSKAAKTHLAANISDQPKEGQAWQPPEQNTQQPTVGSPNRAAAELCTNKPLWEEANPKRKKIDPSNTLSRALARPHTATVSCSMLGLR